MFCMWNEVAWCSCKYSCWRLLSVQAQTKMDTLGLESRGFCLLSSFSCADDIIRQCNCWCIFSNLMFKHLRKNAFRWRPYRVECTGSLLTSEVKQRRARSVLGWGTAWEDLRVLSAFFLSLSRHPTSWFTWPRNRRSREQSQQHSRMHNSGPKNCQGKLVHTKTMQGSFCCFMHELTP